VSFSLEIEEKLKKLVRTSELSHAYLLWGNNATLVNDLAGSFVNYIHKEEWSPIKKDEALSDVLFIFPNTDRIIGINEVRRIKEFVSQKSAYGTHRIVLVEGSECMTQEAQNAILKSVEDPLQSSLFIMTADHLDRLMTPLLSRLFKIYISSSYASLLSEYKKREYIAQSVSDFLKKPPATSEMIKAIVEKEDDMDYFLSILILELRKDIIKNHASLREVLTRVRFMKQFNTNKKLQMEAISQKIHYA